jgi:hypothetical protein
MRKPIAVPMPTRCKRCRRNIFPLGWCTYCDWHPPMPKAKKKTKKRK